MPRPTAASSSTALTSAHLDGLLLTSLPNIRYLTGFSGSSALLFVSHSVEEVVKHCDRALLVEQGRVVQDDTSRAVSNAYLDLVWGKGARGKAMGAFAPFEGGERLCRRRGRGRGPCLAAGG